MLNIEDNKRLMYPKIDTLYNRDTNFKVDETSIKNSEFLLIRNWEVTEKIDGTNVRIILKDKKVYFEGRTEKAELPKDLIAWLKQNICSEALINCFGDKEVTLYGEGYGSKIQNGKGYSEIAKFILFDIRIGKFWLDRLNTLEIARSLNIDSVPFIGCMDIKEITDFVKKGFPSWIGNVPICEGIIARTIPQLFNKVGERLIFKLKHKDF